MVEKRGERPCENNDRGGTTNESRTIFRRSQKQPAGASGGTAAERECPDERSAVARNDTEAARIKTGSAAAGEQQAAVVLPSTAIIAAVVFAPAVEREQRTVEQFGGYFRKKTRLV